MLLSVINNYLLSPAPLNTYCHTHVGTNWQDRGRIPKPTIQLITGQPTYATFSAVYLKLSSSAASINFKKRNKRLGLFKLTVTETMYNSLSEILLITPANPGRMVAIPMGATRKKISQLWHNFDEASKGCSSSRRYRMIQ